MVTSIETEPPCTAPVHVEGFYMGYLGKTTNEIETPWNFEISLIVHVCEVGLFRAFANAPFSMEMAMLPNPSVKLGHTVATEVAAWLSAFVHSFC